MWNMADLESRVEGIEDSEILATLSDLRSEVGKRAKAQGGYGGGPQSNLAAIHNTIASKWLGAEERLRAVAKDAGGGV